MLWGGHIGELELRRRGGSSRLRGSFPYNRTATLSDGGRRGRPRKEKFAPGAFAFTVEDPDARVDLLVGHDFGKPLASRTNGTLELEDTPDALLFEARAAPEIEGTSYAADALAGLAAGLAVGLSPGFRIPPERAAPNAEQIEEEPIDPARGQNGAIIRTITAAVLFELSLVTRPAFAEAQIEARNWEPLIHPSNADKGLQRTLSRWRA